MPKRIRKMKSWRESGLCGNMDILMRSSGDERPEYLEDGARAACC